MRPSQKEHEVLISKTGNVYHTSGDVGAVDDNTIVPGKEKLGSIVTHNHPEGIDEGNFSGDDARKYFRDGLESLRGVDSRSTFGMRARKPRSNVNPDEIYHDLQSGLYQQAQQNVLESRYNGNLTKMMEDDTMTSDYIKDEINRLASEKYGYTAWRRYRNSGTYG